MFFQLAPYNHEFFNALDLLKNSERSPFLTGKDGAGKTTQVVCFLSQSENQKWESFTTAKKGAIYEKICVN